MYRTHWRLWTGVVALTLAARSGADEKQAVFQHVFGEHLARPDPETIARVKALQPGARHYVRSGDGTPAEVWYIDTDRRHQDSCRPILVRAVDEDGDLIEGGEPDLDSDLYLADWKADGTIDSAVDYQDDDGDGDVDQMGIFFFVPSDPVIGGPTLRVWWGVDVGDDNRLWYDVNYNYLQPECQWRSHFGGDEFFCAFATNTAMEGWIPLFENPFAFYDTDRDGESEVVVRISGKTETVDTVRYSFDADNDAGPGNPHDYDVSLTALAPTHPFIRPLSPEAPPVVFGPERSLSWEIRGRSAGPVLAYDRVEDFVRGTRWSRVLLTWDEIDFNAQGEWEKDPHERWEGVINHPSKDFPPMGGPSCGPVNKRNEIDLQPVGPIRLYYDPAEGRIHLRDADQAWLDIDYDLDHKTDMRWTWRDADADGVLEGRQIDVDADGRPELTLEASKAAVQDVPVQIGGIQYAYGGNLPAAAEVNQALIDVLKAVLRAKEPGFAPDEAERFYVERLASVLPAHKVGLRMRASLETARYYQDIVRDRYFVRLLRVLGSTPAADEARRLYADGRYAELVGRLKAIAPEAQEGLAPALPLGMTRRVGLEILNPNGAARSHELVALPMEAIRRAAPDFNPARCVVVAGPRLLDWRAIPHQVDEVSGRSELCFAVTSDGTDATYWLAYHPEGSREPGYPNLTAAAEDWVPPNIGWESEVCGYRAYWGQFDFFGKKREALVMKGFAKGSASYHAEQDWGIDALHVGKTSGIGGLTLYAGQQEFAVQNPEGRGSVEFTKRVLVEGPVRTVVEIVGDKVGPYKVVMHCTAVAGRRETRVDVTVVGPPSEEPLHVAPGFIKLTDEAMVLDTNVGLYATWGRQEPAIGWIGMGLVFEPRQFAGLADLPSERRVRLRLPPDGRTSFLIVGDWLAGRDYPRCPTIENFAGELRDLAVQFRHPLVPAVSAWE